MIAPGPVGRSLSSAVEIHTSRRLRLDRKPEPGRHHADDGEARVVELDGASDHAGVAAEMFLPGLPAQDRRTSAGAAAGRIFFGQERAAEDRRDAEQRKQIGRGHRAAQQLRFAIAGQRQVEVVVGGEAIERSALLAQVSEVAKRKLR